MDEHEEKPFSIVAIVLLLMIAVLDDGTTVAALLSLGIPILGEITFFLDKLFALIAAITINSWFIFKLRTFGKSGIANVAGGILEEASIPATLVTTIIAILMANHPKLTAVAGTLSAAPGLGAEKEALAAKKAAVAAEKKSAAAATARVEAGEAKTVGGGGKSEGDRGTTAGGEQRKEAPSGAAFGERPEAMEVAKQESFGIQETKRREEGSRAEDELSEEKKKTRVSEEKPGPREVPQAGKKPEVSEAEMGSKEAPGEVAEMKELEKLTKETPKVVDIETARKKREGESREEEGEKMKKAA